MYAIIDKRCSKEIKENLKQYVDSVFEFSTEGITYNSISCHPDIFIFQNGKELIIAPNSPKDLFNFLDEKRIDYIIGSKQVGESLENSSQYNCLTTSKYFFSKKGTTDCSIIDYVKGKKTIEISQSYSRCSLFDVGKEKMITSDLGIVKSLIKNNIEHFYFEPSEIKIEDHKYGFIGGTMGKLDDNVFFLGDILKHKLGKSMKEYIESFQQKVICLGSDFLYDGGGIFFIS